VYNAAKYCAPVWGRSAHTKKVVVELNSTMRIISGCVRSTKVQWLPVLSNIAPPEIRRYAATVKILQQFQNSTTLPVHNDISDTPNKRLKSKYPIWSIESTTDIPEDL